MKISILLPFKENFTVKNAGAVSLFVNDLNKISKYRNSTLIYGNTNYNDVLSKNYINLKFNKSLLQSTNKKYIEEFIIHENIRNSDIVEIHNRPSYIKYIKENYFNKIILYFHNDPLTMSGSKTKNERIYLLKNIDKILFNSIWSKNRFFIDFKKYEIPLDKIDICFQSASSVKIDFKKKENIISFVGKLNHAKGYDLFGKAILKILNKHKNWKAKVFGDEPREKIIFKHRNFLNYGFISNNDILDQLKKVSISVICSRWQEPFGRASLEAASRGSAVIISNNGGLPETSSSAIILKELNVKNIFNEVNKLIKNKKLLLKKQKDNYKKFTYTHKYVSNFIDKIRSNLILNKFVYNFNINRKKPLKILHITNFNERFSGRLHHNTSSRINNGFIRLGHDVLSISDRDIIHNNKNILDLSGKKKLQTHILDSLQNFDADCIVLGHADSVSNETLFEIKDKYNHIKIAQWFLDPIDKNGPDYKKNTNRIFNKEQFIDTSFLTSHPSLLIRKLKNSFFIPNPADESFETLSIYKDNHDYDLFFALSHGVHRGELRKGKIDKREIFIKKLVKLNPNINFDLYGINNIQPIWGSELLKKISKCSMALNLSRGTPVKYYSSDRIAQIMGNGMLTFIDTRTFLNDFISHDQAIFYKNIDDLSYKINKYKKDYKNRNRIAKNGKKFYLKKMNSYLVADFILSKTFDYKSKNKFIWNR